MAGSSAVQSQAMSLALVRADALVTGDRVGLSLAQPMRVTSGRMRFDVQTAVDDAGAPVMEAQSFSLVPQGRERLGELSYLRPLGRQSALIYSAAYRHQPNHLAGVPGDTLLAVRYLLAFFSGTAAAAGRVERRVTAATACGAAGRAGILTR